ncbi:MAG: flagellin [Lachnospiraceae bacterium]|nr:flagellin [Lachnospiraceae bacterium]
MVVQHNLTAMNSQRMLGITTSAQAKSTEKLSSGYKINRAADDAAGLSISEKMRRQIRGLTQASANASDGISCVQTAEGALNEVQDMLQRMNELAVKGENGTLTSTDRSYIASEVSQLMSEIDRVKQTTTFNEKSLLDGSFSNVDLQVGAESTKNDKINVKITSMGTSKLASATIKTSNLKSSLITAGMTASAAATAIVNKFKAYGSLSAATKMASTQEIKASMFADLNYWVKAAIKDVSQQRSDLGAIQNRLEHTIANLDNVVENTTAAESQIRDTDMAAEMVKFSNNNILAQAGQSMLAQANQTNQGVLSLLG